MKILFYNHTGQVSGAERVLMMILGGLDRPRYEPVVVCPHGSRMMELAQGAGERTRGLAQLEARFTWRPDLILKHLRSFASVIRQARAVVIEEKPAFIHANSIRAGLVMAAATAGLGVSVIWHAHDVLPLHPLSTAVRLMAAITSHNHILAVSQAVERAFRGLLLRPFKWRTPITVVHNAVDLDRFRPDEESKTASRRDLNLSLDQPVIAIVGQLTPRKGQLELIESFTRVSRILPDAVLLIIGTAIFNRDEEYAQQLAQTVRSFGLSECVRFLGSRDDVQRLMQAADVLVVNSHEEPFALTVLEGLASGCAVLATSVGGTPEMIQHGANGWLVPPRDREALAAALLTLLSDSDLRRRLGTQARQDALRRFSIERFIAEIHALYLDVSDCGALPQLDRGVHHRPASKTLPCPASLVEDDVRAQFKEPLKSLKVTVSAD